MLLITAALPQPSHHEGHYIEVPVDRLTLAKRRWRGVAADGREFGFDLEHPLADGDVVWSGQEGVYRIAQKAEPVLSIALGEAEGAARLGWLLGNLHFRVSVAGGVVQVPDDPAVRQMLEREHVHYQAAEAVFRPLGGGHAHGH